MTVQYTQGEILASLQEAHRRLEERSLARHEPIAVIGMSCRFPGGVMSPADYWRLLREGRSGIVQFSDEELRAAGEAYERADYVKVGAVLQDIEHFDGVFFGIPAADLEVMDPQHRLLMQGVWEALEDAGYAAPEHRGIVGLFAGCSVNQYFLEQVSGNEGLAGINGSQLATGNEKDYLASKIAYQLDLTGPAVNVQSACSTSLVAAHYAVQSLRLGECDIAVAGGATVKVPHRAGYRHKTDGIRSLQGECRAFDERADGTVEGNGMGLVVLKLLRNAIKDRDHVHAVIKGSAVNNDGFDKVSFAAPSVSGQEDVIVRALENARIDPQTLQYFEAHGTGTRVGDPIEIAAATKAFGRWTRRTGFCALGAVKSSIGHADAAAGVAGLIKVALSLQHREIPPTLNFNAPNPALSLANSPFYVNTALTPWPGEGIARAAVSSFGIGGTNSHMVLEQAPEIARSGYDRGCYILPVSAKSERALAASEQRLRRHFMDHPDLDLADAAHTLAVGRKAFSYRSVIVAPDLGSCIAQLGSDGAGRLRGYQNLRNVPVVFVFPGDGIALADAGGQLYEMDRSYRESVNSCLSTIKDVLNVDVDRYLGPPSDSADVLGYHLRLFVAGYALATAWIANGVRPGYLVGQGVGEYAAACVGEVMTVVEAISMLARRAAVMRAQLSSSPAEEVLAFQAFQAAIARIHFKPAKLPMAGDCLAKDSSREGVSCARYWTDELRGSGRFVDAIASVLQQNNAVFLEMGRGTVLATQVRTIPGVVPDNCIASLATAPAAETASQFIFAALGRLWLRGANIDWPKFYAGAGCRRLSLPTYPFEQQRHWMSKHPPTSNAVAVQQSKPGGTPGGEVHCYLPVWKRMPFTLRAQISGGGSCLLFHDGSQLAQALQSALAAFDIAAIVVTAGSEFVRGSPYAYTLDPQSEADYHRLMQQLLEQGTAPRMLLHLWGLERREGRDDVAREPSFWSLYYIVKAWTRLGIASRLHAGVLSSNVENVTGSEAIVARNSLVFGGCHAIQHELANARCQHFDISFGGAPSRQTLQNVCSAIVMEVLSNTAVPRVAYRDGRRWLMDFSAIELADTGVQGESIKEGSVYWITGGLGGIGMELADLLTQRANVTLILIQRTELPPRSQRSSSDEERAQSQGSRRMLERIMQMEARGSKVVLARADVTDAQAMRELYEKTLEEHGGLNGIVHAAGVPGGGFLALKSRADVENVFAPKVLGTMAIYAALDARVTLDFFVLCSSVTALAGGPGRSDYGAANCFLDAFAVDCNRSGDTSVLSINWDQWRDTGMAAAYLKEGKKRTKEAMARSHPLLEQQLSSDAGTSVYCTHFSEATHWVVRDHLIDAVPSLPGVAYIEMIAAALRPETALEIRDLMFMQPLMLAPGGTTAVMEIRTQAAEHRIRVFSADGASPGKTVLHAQARATLVAGESSRIDIASLKRNLAVIDLQELDAGEARGRSSPLQLGPSWNVGVESCHAGEAEFLACLTLPDILSATAADYYLHVSLFDMATTFALRRLSHGQTYLPVGYEKLRIERRMPRRIYSHVKYRTAATGTPEIMTFDVRLFDGDGVGIASVTNFAVKKIGLRVPHPRSVPADAQVDSAEIFGSKQGLSTAGALRAFLQLIAQRNYPQVIVSAVPLPDAGVIASLDAGEANPQKLAEQDVRPKVRSNLSTPYEAPADDLERKIASLWQAKLGIEPIGVNDDYTELGGDSLVAMRLVDKIAVDFHVNISIVSLYDRPTIRGLAHQVRELLPTAAAVDRESPDAALARKSQARKEFLGRSAPRYEAGPP